MANTKKKPQDETYFKVLRLLQNKPNITQRELAQKLGISLGGINFCLNALIDKGWLKMQNFSQSNNKLGYAYLLTPTGLAEKATLTGHFLKRKMQEYQDLKVEIATLKSEVTEADKETIGI